MNELLRNFLCENNSEPFSISKMLAGLMRGSLKGQWEISTISINHAIFLDKYLRHPAVTDLDLNWTFDYVIQMVNFRMRIDVKNLFRK